MAARHRSRLALVGDAALAADPVGAIGCGWALQSAEWLAEALVAEPSPDRALAAYRRRHRRELHAHSKVAAASSLARPMAPPLRLLFSAAVHDERIAERIGELRVALDPAARAALAARPGPRRARARPPPIDGRDAARTGGMKLLVTGGAGYIGSVVANQLLERGHEVAVLDDLSRGHRGAVPDGARHLEVGLADAEGTKDALAEGFDGVLHFAALALVAESVEFPERYHRGNFVGTLNLLDAMREHDVKRLVFSSTCATYGEPEVVPMPETLPTNPVNSYGNSKLAVDRMIGDECRAHGLGAISLRYFNVAGASGPYGEDHYPETHLIPLVLQAAAGTREHVSVFGTDYPTEDGTAVRDYIHVEDLGRAHLLAMDALQRGKHTIYNLGNGLGFSVRQVIEAARKVTGRDIPVKEEPRRPGDPAQLVASSEKIRAELGWEPEKDLETMIADAWAWRQARPDGYGRAASAA